MRDSHETNAPLISVGNVAYSAKVDLPIDRQEFVVPTFISINETSEFRVEYNGIKLMGSSQYNDYYGFGTSPESALYAKANFIEKMKGCNADFLVVAALEYDFCLTSDNTPFYKGAQMIRRVDRSWRMETSVPKLDTERFVVWKNGKKTKDADRYYDRVIELVSQDAAPLRNAPLRCVSTIRNPISREEFLTPESSKARYKW